MPEVIERVSKVIVNVLEVIALMPQVIAYIPEVITLAPRSGRDSTFAQSGPSAVFIVVVL